MVEWQVMVEEVDEVDQKLEEELLNVMEKSRQHDSTGPRR
jgi:hypothetical protein